MTNLKDDRKRSLASTMASSTSSGKYTKASKMSTVKPLDEEDSIVGMSDDGSRDGGAPLQIRLGSRNNNRGGRQYRTRHHSSSSSGGSSSDGSSSSNASSKSSSPDSRKKPPKPSPSSWRAWGIPSPNSPTRSPKLREMKEEQNRRMEEEKQRLEEADRDRQGFSMKTSKLAIGEWPGDDASFMKKMQYYVQVMLSLQKFDACIGVVILINSITIGWESHYQITNQDTKVFEDIEHAFVAIYGLELMARFFAFGPTCLKSGWVAFDALLVGVGILSTWVLPSIYSTTPEGLGPLLVLRVLRLLRLARAVRLLVAFKTLWMLVRGLLASAGTMVYTFVLIFLILYVSGVLGVELITKSRDMYVHDPDLLAIVDNHFEGLLSTMLTLVQFVTLDSIGGIYGPLIKHTPGLAIYFMGFILIVAIALMNLVTAVIVEGAIEQAKADKEVQAAYEAQRLQRLLPELRIMFEALDEDGSGDITKEELVNGLTGDPSLKDELCGIMGSDDPVEIFEMLDIDGGGGVSIDEFCEQIMKSVTSDRPIELERILKLVKDVPMLKRDLETLVHANGGKTAQEERDEELSGNGEHQGDDKSAKASERTVPLHIEKINARLTKIESTMQEILRKIDVGYMSVEYC